MVKTKKQMFIVISVFALVMLLGTVTYAFFNYTRVGSANTVKTGKIAFNAENGVAINLTNVFPIDVSEGIPDDNTIVGSVTIHVTGDTTYEKGVEYLVSAVNVTNIVGTGNNQKRLPIGIDVSYTANGAGKTIGSEDNNYFDNRNNASTSLYHVLASNSLIQDSDIMVGYIKNGETGIDGNIVIKAFIDKDRIAISDTYDGTETGNMGTTTEWVDERTVFTTNEWNSLQTNGISFQIKVEANEGLWYGKIDTCPGCKFTYYVEALPKLTTWNMDGWDSQNQVSFGLTPSQFTTNLYDSYLELMNVSGKNHFLGLVLNENNEAERAYACGIKNNKPFCLEGSLDGAPYENIKTLLQGRDLYNNTCIEGSNEYGLNGHVDEIQCDAINGDVYAWADSDGYINVGTNVYNKCYVDGYYGHVGCFAQ